MNAQRQECSRLGPRARHVLSALALLAVGAAGVMASFAIPASGSHSLAALTVVVRGSDTAARLSPKTFTVGRVPFKIVNSGRKPHVFVVKGKRLRLRPRTTLMTRITFGSHGTFKWSWSGTRARGALTVKARVGSATTTVRATTVATSTTVATTTVATTTAATTTAATTTVATTTAATTTAATTTVATTTAATTTAATTTVATTTIAVDMFEYRFELSQNTVPHGPVTFVITNKGSGTHNFDITGLKAGAFLSPGQSETWTVQLSAGSKNFKCDLHDSLGMNGSLSVT
jgi:plastocyanin